MDAFGFSVLWLGFSLGFLTTVASFYLFAVIANYRQLILMGKQ